MAPQSPPPFPAPLGVDFTAGARPDAALTGIEQADRLGIDRALFSETAHDPFQLLALASGRTTRIELATGVAIAFARTPMTLAHSAWDLQRYSGGRAVIGLGSQVKPHITRRYAMPWDRPAARMREFVSATRAVWHSWQTGQRLAFRGDFYTHTLMTPFFDPGPLDHGAPRLLIAGVGPLMSRVAGEVGDGLVCHPLNSPSYLAERLLPGVLEARADSEAAGAAWTAGRPFEVSVSVLTATGRTEEELAASVTAVRERIAFYASTPAYRAVLDHHGWGALHDELHTLSMRGRWQEMGRLVDDDVLHTFAAVGDPAEAGRRIADRYTGIVSRVSVSLPDDADPADAFDVLAAIRSAA
ncbi:TIGR03617 family F420-dependent LLM class oxidoreductase [Kitasatospora terrestris]|uniref:LLM class F420-dependent oxidoreductase n=1 Tax=Kitasatospora terrestris TaxID=258051 RepID=A0ABP9ELZ0_9ACTN